MATAAFVVAVTLLSVTPVQGASLEAVARQECRHNKSPSPARISRLLDIEREAGIPDLVRGILVAAACRESGYKAVITGDGGKSEGIVQWWGWAKPSISKIRKRLCEALPEAKKKLSIHCMKLSDSRHDWIASAIYWAQRLTEMYKKAQVFCGDGQAGYDSMEMRWWASANLTVGGSPVCFTQGRCLEREGKTCKRHGCALWGVHCARKGRKETKHMKVWRRWQEIISEMDANPG